MSEPRPLTGKQAQTLAAIRDWIAKHGYPPSRRQLGDVLGIAPTSVQQQIVVLARKGWIVVEPGRPRALRVLHPPVTTLDAA